MKTILLPLTLILGIVLSGNGCSGGQTESEPSQTAEITVRTGFTFNLYQAVVKDKPNENITISPFGAELVLNLARAGASGETAAEIERLLGNTGAADWNTPSPNSPLVIATALWMQEEYPVRQEFVETARKEFGALVEQADFVSNPDEAVQRINNWCSEETNGKIPTLFDRLGETTRCVLTGALHFAADWKTQFSKDLTTDGSFTLIDGVKLKTKIMSRTGLMQYAETDDTIALELPYMNDGYAMLLLLPRNPAGFEKWEAEMTPEIWNAVRGALYSEQIDLRMPRFTMESSLTLNESLQRLGMPMAFSQDADFSKINGQLDLYLSEVRQKTFVKVDEKGTEAAAATGGVMQVKSMVTAKPFYADRPFLFAVIKNDTILFLGRLMKPDIIIPDAETSVPVPDPDLDGEGGTLN